MALEDLVEMILQRFVFPGMRKAWVVFVSIRAAFPCRVTCAINILTGFSCLWKVN